MLICCSQAKIILNEFKTELFGCLVGLKQGSCESSGLFAIYINSLDEEIKKSNIGVKISNIVQDDLSIQYKK